MVDVHRTCDRVIPLSEASKNIKSGPIKDKITEKIENLISISDKLLKNGDDNIEEMQHQENAIHAQISQRKSKIIENFDKKEKVLYEDLTTGKKKVQERVQEQEIKVESIRTEILKYNQELDFVECHASNIQGYLQLRNVKEELHQQSNGLHTVFFQNYKCFCKIRQQTKCVCTFIRRRSTGCDSLSHCVSPIGWNSG
jgi:hypothetical protein